MTTRSSRELDARMEAEEFLTARGVLAPRKISPEGEAMWAEWEKVREEAMKSDLPWMWVPGQGWKPDPDLYSRLSITETSAAKPR
jgi:hypothetical protein